MCTRLQFENGSIAPDFDIFNVQLQQTSRVTTADKGNFMQHTSALLHQTEAPHRKFLWVCGVNLEGNCYLMGGSLCFNGEANFTFLHLCFMETFTDLNLHHKLE